jgi:hypothetical protein
MTAPKLFSLDKRSEIYLCGLSPFVDDHLPVHYSRIFLSDHIPAYTAVAEIFLFDIPDDVPVAVAELYLFQGHRYDQRHAAV